MKSPADVAATVARARTKLRVLQGGRPRSFTIPSYRNLTNEELHEQNAEDAEQALEPNIKRPVTRQDCLEMERPCPFVSCFYHLYLDVNENGSIKLNFPHLDVSELKESCALDVADVGGVTLEEVANVLNVSRERVRQIQDGAMRRMLKSSDEVFVVYRNDAA